MCQIEDWTEPFGFDIVLRMVTKHNKENTTQSLPTNTE